MHPCTEIVLEFHIFLPQSRYRDRNNENLIHGLSLYQSNLIVICLKVTPVSFHEKCEISPIDMTSPDDEVITSRHMVHSLSSGKGKMFLCAACHAFTPHVNAWKNLIGIVVQIQARG